MIHEYKMVSHFTFDCNFVFYVFRLNLLTNLLDQFSHKSLLLDNRFYYKMRAFCVLYTIDTKVEKTSSINVDKLMF